MPNQRDPNKKMLAIWADKSLQKKLDDFVKKSGANSQSEAIQQLLKEALEARKSK
jgi:metal-responsive CopG/Arc/MetJ family transcriptional regulator